MAIKKDRLCYLRVPTWGPFRLQFYCNGHGWLAPRLTAVGVGDWERAQVLADTLEPKHCIGFSIASPCSAVRSWRPLTSAIIGA
jgi:hypothetical protein